MAQTKENDQDVSTQLSNTDHKDQGSAIASKNPTNDADASRKRSHPAPSSNNESPSNNNDSISQSIDLNSKTSTNADESSSPPPLKKQKTGDRDDDKTSTSVSVLNVAHELGYRAGDEFIVKWDLELLDENEQETTKTITRDWACRLVEHDGRTTADGVAIRVLDYEAYPEGGYPERSTEEVIVCSESALLDLSSGQVLEYRPKNTNASIQKVKETTTEQNTAAVADNSLTNDVISMDSDSLRQYLNDMLMDIINKCPQWHSLDAARKAHVASVVAKGKERFINVLLENNNNGSSNKTIITAKDIPMMLEQAFGGR